MLSRRPRVHDAAQPRVGVTVDAAELVLRVLTSSANRKGSLANAQLDRQRTLMLHTIRRHTARERPVELTLMAFPFKVPNPAKVGARVLPDLAESSAFTQLKRLHSAIREVYEPGIRIHLILDGRALAPIVGIERAEVEAYERYLCRLIVDAGATDFVAVHDFSELLGDGGPDSAAESPRLLRAARRWYAVVKGSEEWPAVFQRTLGMVNLRDMPLDAAARLMTLAREGRLPTEWADVEARVNAAVIAYRAFDLVVHELDPRSRHFPDAIHATTTDRPGRLAIWLVRRGRSHLPWHGVAAVNGDGKVRVGPLSDLIAQGGYEPIYLGTEDTPFAYRRS